MKLTLYQVDAFTNKLFGGNPAAVIPLENWITDDLMQKLALENNLSETVFFVPAGEDYDIRWFTPTAEINLCGHATLASAFVLYHFLDFKKEKIIFHSKSGKLEVHKREDVFVMDFPAWKPERVYNYPGNLRGGLGVNEILAIYKHRDLMVLLENEKEVKNAKPNFTAIKKWNEKVIITAPGNGDVDFVSRCFFPQSGIDEDPVTGSAHTSTVPYWAEQLGKTKLKAIQLSKRRGYLDCELKGDRVLMRGNAVTYMKGEYYL